MATSSTFVAAVLCLAYLVSTSSAMDACHKYCASSKAFGPEKVCCVSSTTGGVAMSDNACVCRFCEGGFVVSPHSCGVPSGRTSGDPAVMRAATPALMKPAMPQLMQARPQNFMANENLKKVSTASRSSMWTGVKNLFHSKSRQQGIPCEYICPMIYEPMCCPTQGGNALAANPCMCFSGCDATQFFPIDLPC